MIKLPNLEMWGCGGFQFTLNPCMWGHGESGPPLPAGEAGAGSDHDQTMRASMTEHGICPGQGDPDLSVLYST